MSTPRPTDAISIQYCSVCGGRRAQTVFVDASTSYLVVYDVDAAWRVTSSRRFELCRVAFCSAALHPSDRRLMVWLYHPPPAPGEPRRPALLETHVVQLSTELRARRLAVRIGDAFQRLYAEVRHSTHERS